MLELRDVSRRYGDVVALDGVSFAVDRGQMRGLVGRNGAGKTTAMPIRMGAGEAQAWEVVTAVGLVLVSIVLVVRVAARIYAGGALRTRGKIKLREAWAGDRG